MRYLRWLIAVVVASGIVGVASACPFCSSQGQTFTGEVNQADFILVGELRNAKRDNNDITRGTTELHIETVVKDHPYLAGKKMITLPRYVPTDGKADERRYLVFCAVYPQLSDLTRAAAISSLTLADFRTYTVDPYRGEPLKADSLLPKYLQGSLKIREQGADAKLNYFYQYLDSPELLISSDAYMEFGNADYPEVMALSKTLAPEKLLKWLKDPQTPASRFGLYGMMLGHCGTKDNAEQLLSMINDTQKTYSSGLDGLFTGYLMLDPKLGWEQLKAVLKDESKEFPVRYAALKAVRFFAEYRPDLLTKDQIGEVMMILVKQPDIADLPIEDLRKWGRWDLADQIIQIGSAESHQSVNIVRRAVLRYALSASEKSKVAKDFVDEQRKLNPDRVKMVEEFLVDEKKTLVKGE